MCSEIARGGLKGWLYRSYLAAVNRNGLLKEAGSDFGAARWYLRQKSAMHSHASGSEAMIVILADLEPRERHAEVLWYC